MYRIILMVVRLFYKVPYYLMRIWWLGTRKNFNLEENYAFIKKVTKAANRAGRVKIESYGLENIPKEDIKQSLQVINQMTEEVKKGRNFLIFPEGTRSRMGNQLLPFKGGTFKSAVRAKCPIVPCALIDSYKPFDEKSIAPVTVKLIYLKPICYEEYKQLKTPEIADLVKSRIEEAIKEYL